MADLIDMAREADYSPGEPRPRPTMRIGRLRIEPPVQLAAIAGYSDAAMRHLCRSFGAPYAVAEMMLDDAILTSKRVRNEMTLQPDDHPIAGQILTSSPDTAARAARTLVEMGYDAIDLNMACPVPKILNKGRGGTLMKDPARAAEQIRAVRAAIDPAVPLSLKLRIGWDEAADSYRNLCAILEAAVQAGVAAITVHGRLVVQRYKGRADWDAIARVRRFVGDSVRLLGSGDVLGAADVIRMLEATGVDGVSVARGAIGQPWIFRQVADLLAGRQPYVPDPVEQGRIMRRHFELARQVCRRESDVARHMRKFGIFYSRGHPQAKQVRLAFIATSSAADWNAVIDRWYK